MALAVPDDVRQKVDCVVCYGRGPLSRRNLPVGGRLGEGRPTELTVQTATKPNLVLTLLWRPAVSLGGGAAHQHCPLAVAQAGRLKEGLDRLLVVDDGEARVQSVPHRQRSNPQASNRRASGSQMSGKG